MKENQSIIRIMTVDDHPLVHEGIAALLADQPGMEIITNALSGREALEKYREFRPDVTLLDLRLGDMSGIDALIAIRGEFPGARVIMLTMFEGDVEIQRAMKSGASAYLLKSMSSDTIVETIRRVHTGKKHVAPEIAAQLAEHLGEETLSPRETEVLRLVSGGNRNQDIAVKLFISEETVKIHVRHILEKLNASDRTQAVAIALRRGIIQL
ncbi:MAG TPA: response regulator transcription factor [Pyrinomonadaceae bacterium]|jgi:DNA-binding NarL/FixJ family response regulator